MIETPLRVVDGNWHIDLQSGREIRCQHHFEEIGGYQISISFTDSIGWNLLTPRGVGVVVSEMRRLSDNPDALALAEIIDIVSDKCSRLNVAWVANGRPRGGLESLVHGHA